MSINKLNINMCLYINTAPCFIIDYMAYKEEKIVYKI